MSKYHELNELTRIHTTKAGGTMNHLLLAALFLFATIASASNPPQPQHRQQTKIKLNLTEAQQEQFQKISFETQKKQIDLRAKAETAKLELNRLMNAASIDKSSIEKKFTEIASLHTALKMNRLNEWIDKNKVLTPEQQLQWKKELRAKRHYGKEKIRGVQIERMRMERRPMMQRQIQVN
jgi:Spy/CpxP family protein refolding chaperone